jgi:hypothetical protein
VGRFVVPVLFLIGAGVMWQYNATSETSQVIFPGVWLVPGYEEDIRAQGRISAGVVAGLGLLLLGGALLDTIRSRRTIDHQS